MSKKECPHHDDDDNHQLNRQILAGILGFIFLVLLVIFLIWIILRPTKPRFILQDATVYTFNFSTTGAAIPTPNTLTTTMQVTLTSFNPNQRIGIYYTKLDVYASYRGQQISLATQLPPSYQGHRDVTVWSPFLYGNAVPVSPFLLEPLQQDQNAGDVLVNVKVNGRVKWKVGTWVSGRYHVYANCPAYIKFVGGDRDNAVGASAPEVKLASPGLKLSLVQSCNVDV
ncbi:hypothetical protein HN51_043121 [Arachis hypogaea]|uniref:Late embryogenesis abundant protein LEA-2 subgroup domain-containing protein n=1 Tax=Arachis hypogaea TaxID=3818 RepID=A0A444Y757_ARAHY|nr:NDR1/HIN1-like protein 12 [Arachis ipaensis]XP_025673264.1 NDR1/HIN1-like protein 12 [Arachis hypogaea]RYQ97774.1 hypothetical protein Ahy_B08g093855 [Arachis hypogaea]